MQNKSSQILQSLLFPVFVSCFVLFQLFQGSNFELASLKKLIISQATMEGIDVGARTSLLFKLMLLGAGLLSITHWTYKKLAVELPKNLQDLVNWGAVLGCISIIIELSGTASHVLTELCFGSTLLLLATAKLWKESVHSINFPTAIKYGAITGYVMHLLFFANNSIPSFFEAHLGLWFIGWTSIFSLILFFILQTGNVTEEKLRTFLLGLAFIPFALFIGLEMQVSCLFATWRLPFLILALTGIAVTSFVLLRRPKLLPNKRNTDKFVWGPSLLFSFCFLAFYSPYVNQPFETFELANPANSMLKVYRYNEIPFIDFFSSHLLSEQWYGYLYSSIYGFDGSLSFLTFKFLNWYLLLLLIYAFINHIWKKPALSILFVFLFPFLEDFFFPGAFFPFLLYPLIMRKAKTSNFLLIVLLTVALIFWRLDAGISAVMSLLVFLPIRWFLEKTSFDFKKLVKGITGSVLILATVIVFAIRELSFNGLLDRITTVWHYISGSQAHGYAFLTSEMTPSFVWYHLVMPAISLLAIFYLIQRIKNKTHGHLEWLSLFLYILSLANVQRGLVRHGFVEHNELYIAGLFFIASALLVTSHFKGKRPVQQLSVFTSCLFFVFFSTKVYPNLDEKTYFQQHAESRIFKNLLPIEKHEELKGRVLDPSGFVEGSFGNLKHFLDHHLSDEQTFLDFSNTPILYFYCQRPVPGYFNQNLQNSVDDYLQKDLLSALDPEKVPVVVFSSTPNSWFDATDGVPNTLRYHLITSYIYENYKPYQVIDQKNIWISKSWEKVKNAGGPKPEVWMEHHYKQAAYYIGKHFEGIKRTKKNSVQASSIINPKNDTVFSAIPLIAMSYKDTYLNLNIESNHNQELQVLINDGTLGKISLQIKAGTHNYTLFPSTLYLWWKLYPGSHLRFIPSKSRIEIKSIVYEQKNSLKE